MNILLIGSHVVGYNLTKSFAKECKKVCIILWPKEKVNQAIVNSLTQTLKDNKVETTTLSGDLSTNKEWMYVILSLSEIIFDKNITIF